MDTKTDYGQAASELSDPMKKAKEAIDTQAASIGQIQNSDCGDGGSISAEVCVLAGGKIPADVSE